MRPSRARDQHWRLPSIRTPSAVSPRNVALKPPSAFRRTFASPCPVIFFAWSSSGFIAAG
jgi:hypothetical protein